MKPICSVEGCGKPKVAHGLCAMHRTRLEVHGDLRHTRPKDWGQREKHPMYQRWCWLRRKARHGTASKEWAADFDLFISDVGEPPSSNHRLHPKNNLRPIGPDNWRWEEWVPHADRREYAKKWRDANPHKAKNTELRSKFGITLLDYARILEQQGGQCKLCRADKPGGKGSFHVDHCHETQKIRGLLCHHCNVGLGHFKDSPDLLQKAISYLM